MGDPQTCQSKTIRSPSTFSLSKRGSSNSSHNSIRSNKSDEEGILRDTVFGISLLWDTISSYLNCHDLLSCRLVSPFWNQIASSTLLKEDCLTVNFYYNNHSRRFNNQSHKKLSHQYNNNVVDWDGNNTLLSRIKRFRRPSQDNFLSDLISTLNYSTNFPCSSFRFKDGALDIELSSLLILHGHLIKTLALLSDYKLGLCTPEMDTTNLLNLLSTHLPNLSTLELGLFRFSISQKMEKTHIPSLRKIICDSKFPSPNTTTFMIHLFKSCPNLELLQNFNCHFTQYFEQGKMGIVKEYGLTKMELGLQEFAKAKPRLSSLTLMNTPEVSKAPMDHRIQYTEGLNLLLEESKNSLQKLNIQPLGLLQAQGLQFPILRNVRTLGLWKWGLKEVDSVERLIYENEDIVQEGRDRDKGFFPMNSNVQNIFPNLKTVNIHSTDLTGVKGSFAGVQKVGMYGVITKEGIMSVKELFTNVKRLIIQPEFETALVQQVRDVCESFASKELDCLQINCGSDWISEKYSWDEAFTGMSRKTCHSLSKKIKRGGVDSLDEKLVEFPSIRDMKQLKMLKFVVSNQDMDVANFIFWTRVTGVYGFSLVPQLKVVVTYHQYCSSANKIKTVLEPLTPFTTIRHAAVKFMKPGTMPL